jgi:hypothetical protein
MREIFTGPSTIFVIKERSTVIVKPCIINQKKEWLFIEEMHFMQDRADIARGELLSIATSSHE